MVCVRLKEEAVKSNDFKSINRVNSSWSNAIPDIKSSNEKFVCYFEIESKVISVMINDISQLYTCESLYKQAASHKKKVKIWLNEIFP